jgi:2-dehydro-3-deoxy-D-arabinonate dehydratase
VTIGMILALGWDTLTRLEAASTPLSGPLPILPPVDEQDVWAAGVTYDRSRTARLEESGNLDAYDKVYQADRPELFFKSTPSRVRGPGQTIGVRQDSSWNVPEPELGLVADANGTLVAYVLGNDVSSRSIEGENPLYLPQAKVYQESVAIGPCLVGVDEAPDIADMTIQCTVGRDGTRVFHEAVDCSSLRRGPDDLLAWLFAALDFPRGVVLLTGTGIVPDTEFTLLPGDTVTIQIADLGVLSNVVREVGTTVPANRRIGTLV